jgi:hypothetical protein
MTRGERTRIEGRQHMHVAAAGLTRSITTGALDEPAPHEARAAQMASRECNAFIGELAVRRSL